jgi:tetratricopeptide (TPR) repeat protein
MKRIILRGVPAVAIALAVALPGLLAQPQAEIQRGVEALKAMFGAQTADARIAAAENVLTKFADTDFKAVALYFEAASYREKGDYEHTVVFGERTLEADPKHYQAMLMLAAVIAAAHQGIRPGSRGQAGPGGEVRQHRPRLLKDAPKPNPNLTDDQWAGAKKDFAADGARRARHGRHGAQEVRRRRKRIQTRHRHWQRPDPSNMVRLGKAYSDDGKYDDAIAQFDKVMAMQDINVQVRQVAQAERVRTFQKKGPRQAADARPPLPLRRRPNRTPRKP